MLHIANFSPVFRQSHRPGVCRKIRAADTPTRETYGTKRLQKTARQAEPIQTKRRRLDGSAGGLVVVGCAGLNSQTSDHFDRNEMLRADFTIVTPSGNIHFVGDSFRAAREKFGHLRLAILPIGDGDPAWFMAYGHMTHPGLPAEYIK